MIFFLILSFFLIILNIFLIGIVFSKICINIENYEAYSNSFPEDVVIDKMNITIDLYLYKFIKIISIRFYRDYLKFGFIKVYYYKIFNYKKQIINGTANLVKILMGRNRLTLEILNPSIENFYLDMNLCSKNAAVTSIITSLLSTTTSMVLTKSIKKYDINKYYYKIIPVYFNINGFKITFSTKINFKTFNILVFLYDYYLIKNNK